MDKELAETIEENEIVYRLLLSGCKAAGGNTLQHRKIRTDAVGVSADKPQKGVYPSVAGWETE